jgi:hypothetical protein
VMNRKHIAEADPYTDDWNPVALAVRDAFAIQFPELQLEKVVVNQEVVGIYLPQKHYLYTCRPELMEWLEEFDTSDEELRPITIKLTVGEAFAMEVA